MICLYRGFDGLDVSFRGQISADFHSSLEGAKEQAQSSQSDICMPFGGMMMMVAGTGAKGGYAYRVNTGKTGATWFFKKPNIRDPWGVRVSCSSFMLAKLGLGRSRSELYDTMERFGVMLQKDGESISRADFAVDILAPNLTLDPHSFVMHSNATRSDHLEAGEISVVGKSGRVSSVTVGKMPGRQVIVYDKRAEVIAKHKWPWLDIWNAGCQRIGLEPLDFTDARQSRVWRAEIRAGKTHLKDRWNIRTWSDLDNHFGDLVINAVESVRLAEPNYDSNRSRWPITSYWSLLQEEVRKDLFEMCNFAPADTIKRINKMAYLDLLTQQGLGLLITRAAIEGIDSSELADFAIRDGKTFARMIASTPADKMQARLIKRAARYDAES